MTFDSELLSNCEKYVKSSIKILSTHQYEILEKFKGERRFFLFPTDVDSYISSTYEYESLINQLSQNSDITKKYNEKTIKNLALTLLTKILYKTQAFEYDENIFNELYRDFKEELYSEKWVIRIIAPLTNFKFDVDNIDFGKRKLNFKDKDISFILKIRKIPEEELHEFLGMNPNTTSMYDPRMFYKFYYHIDCFYYLEKDATNAPNPEKVFSIKFATIPHAILQQVLTVLRLFKEGDVELENYYIRAISFLGGGGLHSRAVSNILNSKYQYILNNSEKDDLNIFMDKMENILPNVLKKENSYFLEFALRYYNFAKERETNEDKLIDYMVVFESLYLNEELELSYRLSNRMATLLGENEQKRQEIAEDIKDLYNLRSSLVHGSLYDYEIPKKVVDKKGIKLSQEIINNYRKNYFKRKISEQSTHKKSTETSNNKDIERIFDELYDDRIRLIERYALLSLKRFISLSNDFKYSKNNKLFREDIVKDLDNSIFNSNLREEIQKKDLLKEAIA